MKSKNELIKILVPLVSILMAFVVGGIIIICLGKNPFEAYGFLFSGALGKASKIAQTLEVACPLIFTGLAASFAYKCGMFNLGAKDSLLWALL